MMCCELQLPDTAIFENFAAGRGAAAGIHGVRRREGLVALVDASVPDVRSVVSAVDAER